MCHFIHKHRQETNRFNNTIDVIKELNEIEIIPEYPRGPPSSPSMTASDNIRKKYIDELINDYIEKYPNVSIADIKKKYNLFSTSNDIKNIKNDLQNTSS